MGRTVHHIPGRIRFKVPDLQCSETLTAALRTGLAVHQGVARVDVRLAAHSVIVHYDPRRTDVDALIAFVEGAGAHSDDGADVGLMDRINSRNLIADSVRHVGFVFGKAVFMTALEKLVQTGVDTAYRSALGRT